MSGGETRGVALTHVTIRVPCSPPYGRLRSVAIPAFPRGEIATGALVSALMDFNREGGLEEIFIIGQGEIVSAIRRRIATEN